MGYIPYSYLLPPLPPTHSVELPFMVVVLNTGCLLEHSRELLNMLMPAHLRSAETQSLGV